MISSPYAVFKASQSQTQHVMNKFHFDGLWCYIGGRLDVDDNTAQEIAHKCMAQGITTWQQFSNLNHSDQLSFADQS